jgi:hypothetical protein
MLSKRGRVMFLQHHGNHGKGTLNYDDEDQKLT